MNREHHVDPSILMWIRLHAAGVDPAHQLTDSHRPMARARRNAR